MVILSILAAILCLALYLSTFFVVLLKVFDLIDAKVKGRYMKPFLSIFFIVTGAISAVAPWVAFVVLYLP